MRVDALVEIYGGTGERLVMVISRTIGHAAIPSRNGARYTLEDRHLELPWQRGPAMIIVLTLGRSGSSLIMQSLHRLGVTVVGRQFDSKPSPALQAEHERLNPGGYLEQPEIYYGGPASEQFKAILDSGQSNIACKMDVRNFVSERHRPFWQSAADRISSVLVSYREPSEQAHSEFLGSGAFSSDGDPQDQFLFITRFLRDYTETYGSIRALLESELNRLRSKTHYIDRASALAPATYVERICESAGLTPPPEQWRSAIANIDPGLFRIRLADIGEEERLWATQLGAATVYAELQEDAGLKS